MDHDGRDCVRACGWIGGAEKGGSSVDAVETAVAVMEDDATLLLVEDSS